MLKHGFVFFGKKGAARIAASSAGATLRGLLVLAGFFEFFEFDLGFVALVLEVLDLRLQVADLVVEILDDRP